MARRPRDHHAEYLSRIANADLRGISKPQATGHHRAGELSISEERARGTYIPTPAEAERRRQELEAPGGAPPAEGREYEHAGRKWEPSESHLTGPPGGFDDYEQAHDWITSELRDLAGHWDDMVNIYEEDGVWNAEVRENTPGGD